MTEAPAHRAYAQASAYGTQAYDQSTCNGNGTCVSHGFSPWLKTLLMAES